MSPYQTEREVEFLQEAGRLHDDHRNFRRKLHALECALALRNRLSISLVRELCVTLSRALACHVAREEQFARACVEPGAQGWSTASPADDWVSHQEESQRLAIIVSRLFVEGLESPVGQWREAVEPVIRIFREHMEAQEDGLLAAPSEHARGETAAWLREASNQGSLSETATVEGIVREHPQTKSFFECLFVDLACQGSDSLGEVAFRRGMRPQELLARIEHAIGHRVGARLLGFN